MPIHTGYQRFKPPKTLLQPTGADIEGPFYLPGAPWRNILCDKPTLVLYGTVRDTDGTPVPEAVLDFWQADAKGNYDEHGPGFRGRQRTPHTGAYRLETVRPGDYQIDDKEFRCAHIHVKISASGCVPLTTQVYFAVDPYNATDHWFSKDRVMGDGGLFDFVLVKSF